MSNSSLYVPVPLTKAQTDIMLEFYSVPNTKVVLTKSERDDLWQKFKTDPTDTTYLVPIRDTCPALVNELERAQANSTLIQSAIFSECVYAQTLANMLRLIRFHIFEKTPDCLTPSVLSLISSYCLKPRYVYTSEDGRKALVQAGGPDGVDSALIQIEDNNVFTIEFKEPAAKTSEVDLPFYAEDGFLRSSPEFESAYAHFTKMVREQVDKRLNFWDVAGTNVNEFSPAHVQEAVTNNYTAKKYADVVCVEDTDNYLAMLPANQMDRWAEIRGEIRPAGRNPYKVWTPQKLAEAIAAIGGVVTNCSVVVQVDKLETAKRRGGDASVSRYKLKSVFFVRAENLRVVGDSAYFQLADVRQLKPTVSAHIFFVSLKVDAVRSAYGMVLR